MKLIPPKIRTQAGVKSHGPFSKYECGSLGCDIDYDRFLKYRLCHLRLDIVLWESFPSVQEQDVFRLW